MRWHRCRSGWHCTCWCSARLRTPRSYGADFLTGTAPCPARFRAARAPADWRAQHRRNGRALRHHERSGRLAPAGAALVVSAVIAHVASLLAMTRSPPLAGPVAVAAWYYVAVGAALAAGGTLAGTGCRPGARARRSICSTGWGSRSSAPSSCCGPWCCAPGSATTPRVSPATSSRSPPAGSR